ncbi:lipopolysaccharide biosynthesis protein [Nocardioides sp. cx-169]|uniref:lipopolysaccharide biosynthesis protein n=1 Tax=Nocardioides sp. cx-169 TaxID=2899080 RepID=UPI001E311ADD|nr:lipopolysaccharide biosynthesis protein [Nocardioides sp. cx-169]MCD4534825.1 lipopolysaccharide biosynthesis protein [Nocardioides sp. cx-169]
MPTATRGAGLRGSAGIAVAMLVMNVTTYGFQMVAARLLGPAEYGAVASLMAFLLVLSVPQLGLQATAARRIAADAHDSRSVERSILRLSYRVAVVVSLAALAATPAVVHLLRLDSAWPALLIGLSAGPLTVMGGQAGVLQGERRWRALGLLYMAMGVPRLLLGCVFIAVSPTTTAAMLAVLLGLTAPAAVGWWALRRPRADPGPTAPSLPAEPARRVIAELASSSVVLLAFLVLTNVDVLIARRTLDEHTAGLYAGGLIVTKAVLFLPQFVIVVLFPSMSAHASRRSALLGGLAVLAGTGAVCTLGAYLLSPLALVFVGGSEYAEVESRLWLFALLGIMLATLQLLVYSALGRESHRSTYLIWAGVAAIVTAGLFATGITGLAASVAAVDAALVVVLAGLALRAVRGPEPRH